ncbi:MAG: helix-turn-helix domain-containing protein, partial [Bacteroidota bacterium]
RTGALDKVKEVEELLLTEIAETPIHDDNGSEYFIQLAESALLFAIYRQDFSGFEKLFDLVEKRMLSLQSSGTARIDVRGWRWYLNYLHTAANRLQRIITIETFEREIDDIEWDELEEQFIYRISGVTGYVYLNEEDSTKFSKSRHWLQKAISEVDMAEGLVFFLNIADYYLANPISEHTARILDSHIKKLEEEANAAQDQNLARIYRAAVLDLQTRAIIHKYGAYDDNHIKLEENLRSVRSMEKDLDYAGSSSPVFVRAFMKLTFSRFYFSLIDTDLDDEDIEDLKAMARDDAMEALSIARRMKDGPLHNYLRVHWMTVSAGFPTSTSDKEKEFKEVLNALRKTSNHPAIVSASAALADYYLHSQNARKAYEVLAEMVRRGLKRIDEGGYFLVIKGMAAINKIMVAETKQPGVSWIVDELQAYFDTVVQMIEGLEERLETIGGELFQHFMVEFANFEPASHFNVKVYLRYQFYEMKVLRIAAVVRGDDAAIRVADRLIGEIGAENSPLTFIQANWEEFKTVPNSVRNKVLNKCISISKGDLPLAAEHLDFSYRNLRSYITFKEVNRLGFFLDMQETHLRQLEQGIRLMFFDLYKRGTIFEVVFDMPKFLVEHAKPGFSSQDLEEALNIKGTTAKKYIKIMMEINLIRLERSVGRKHFYKLRKDQVMNRLGQDQKVLA